MDNPCIIIHLKQKTMSLEILKESTGELLTEDGDMLKTPALGGDTAGTYAVTVDGDPIYDTSTDEVYTVALA